MTPVQRQLPSRDSSSATISAEGEGEGTGIDARTTRKLRLKRVIKSVAALANRRGRFRTDATNSVNILAYHRVAADIAKAESEAYYGIVVSSRTFRRHCELIAKSYDVVSLETAIDALNSRRSTTRPLAAITFDDGYQDFQDEAFPVLDHLGLPATVFLPTTYIGQDKPLPHDRLYWLLKIAFERSAPIANAFDRAGMECNAAREFAALRDRLRLTERLVYLPSALRENVLAELETELGDFPPYPSAYRLLDWDAVRTLASAGVRFGGHTSTHVVLTREDDPTIHDEIATSKLELERQLNSPIVAFAYPNGEYNSTIRQVVANAGFQIAVTTQRKINQHGDDALSLGRISLCEESTRGMQGLYSSRVAALRLRA